jgi:pimeloyl-ACP methyl ester carboxylesterase
MSRIPRSLFPSAAVALLLLAACVPVQPLEVYRSNPARHLIHIENRNIYVEQAGQGEPVLLIHGFGGSSYSWRKVVPALAEDYWVVALDLYGFGWTDRPDDWSCYTRDGQVELILGVMDALGIDNAHLIGHSYGGSISMALAADHPERVRSMVLVDSAAVNYPMNRRKWFARVSLFNFAYVRGLALRQGFVERVMEKAYYDDSAVTGELVETYLERLRVEGAAHGFRGLSRPLPKSKRPRGDIRYEDLDIPTLILWGAQDELISLEIGRYYAQFFPDARFVSIEASGHAPMEEKPAEFLAQVKSFFEQLEESDSRTPVVSFLDP